MTVSANTPLLRIVELDPVTAVFFVTERDYGHTGQQAELCTDAYPGQNRGRVSFGWGTDIDTAALDVQATLEDERSELPDDIVGPRVSKFDVNSFPVVLLAISSALDPVELTEIVEN